MPVSTIADIQIDSLKALTLLIQKAEGFHGLVASLQNGNSGSVDGAWGSSGSLACAALGLHAPSTFLLAIAHPRDVDGWAGDLESFSGIAPVVFPASDDLSTDSGTANEAVSQRLRILNQLQRGTPPRFLLVPIQALIQPVPDPAQFQKQRQHCKIGDTLDLDIFSHWLLEYGYRRKDVVELAGEFSRRGGIIDAFSPEAEFPYRFEFFGDEIESIRTFSPQTQRSLDSLTDVELLAVHSPAQHNSVLPSQRGHLADFLPQDAWTALVEPDELQEQGKHFIERAPDAKGLFSVNGVFQKLLQFPSVTVSALPMGTVETACHLRIESVERFTGNVTKIKEELTAAASGDRILIACHNDAERNRLTEIFNQEENSSPSDRVVHEPEPKKSGRRKSPVRESFWPPLVLTGHLCSGFRMVDARMVLLGDHELFHREEARPVLPRRRQESRAIDSFLELAEGDLVVHVSHGIARYRGMEVLEKNNFAEEHLILEFREGTRVYVPASKIDLVQKYVGGSKSDPELSKLGGTGWQHKKDKVEAAVLDLASEMVDLQAVRAAQPGIAYPSDTEWQAKFEAAFPYSETPDQLTTLGELKQDMERARPMDRLICGDVGYGKTELAMRAAFKAVDYGKQVAVLVPTTVLAEQHFRTFSQRFAEYPFVVEGISRFRTASEQRKILERVSKGGVDIIIGTHRLVSADVHFKDLGLVIIDEEQRFGVEHKERLKRLRRMVDVLTLTATPIPRTLHLSLLGIRDISNLETPPADRLAIETRITRFDHEMIRHAILRELNRDGQVYFVHNRVYNIKEIANVLQSIVPEARISIAHGQMAEHELEQAMLHFVKRDSDILVATTIIESGLDIPNANTIFINQADNYGLADLHQLRGRVGRYKHRAYAYMLLSSERGVNATAARRLKAIEEFTALGAGFKIALRDLEIRGAGNILGNQQSGHIAAVGYEMYCQLLENAVRGLKKQPLRTPLEVTVELPWKAFLPRAYVSTQRLRIEVYRRLARIRRPDRLQDFQKELRDRFGALPEPVDWLMRHAELRLLASRWQIGTVHMEGKLDSAGSIADIVLGYRSPRQIKRLAQRSEGRLRIVDSASAYFRLKPGEHKPETLYRSLKHLLRLSSGSI